MNVTMKRARKLYRLVPASFRTSFRAWVRFEPDAANLTNAKLKRIRDGA